jgi:hypothetical protein
LEANLLKIELLDAKMKEEESLLQKRIQDTYKQKFEQEGIQKSVRSEDE